MARGKNDKGSEPERILILGAAGRDFHTFNVCFRDDPSSQVVAFTTAQIPGIENRCYPESLSGPLYPDGIPIFPETDLELVIHRYQVQQVILAYSDLSHISVMHLASRALACGADFHLIGPDRSSLVSHRPVISVCAVRTGCGKDAVIRRVAGLLHGYGLRAVVVRHPISPVKRCNDSAQSRIVIASAAPLKNARKTNSTSMPVSNFVRGHSIVCQR
jgi:predicted GTPase